MQQYAVENAKFVILRRASENSSKLRTAFLKAWPKDMAPVAA